MTGEEFVVKVRLDRSDLKRTLDKSFKQLANAFKGGGAGSAAKGVVNAVAGGAGPAVAYSPDTIKAVRQANKDLRKQARNITKQIRKSLGHKNDYFGEGWTRS